MKLAIQQLMGQQVTLDKLPYLLRLLTDQVNFWYAYWDLDVYDDFGSKKIYLCLFVSSLQQKMWAQKRLRPEEPSLVTFSEKSYLMKISPNLVLLPYTYVDFNAFDDFDSFKVVSLFVCLLFTRILNNHISRTNTFIMFILKKKRSQ